jgi:bacterioferritin (cytochrome b1)
VTRLSRTDKSDPTPFLSDVTTLRERARRHIEGGAVGASYVGDVERTIDILQAVLATELVCVLRYTQHSIAVDHYRELIRYFSDNDPTTRSMLESILAVEEEHASDMLDLLAVHDRKA